jgi:hypothetical protein
VLRSSPALLELAPANTLADTRVFCRPKPPKQNNSRCKPTKACRTKTAEIEHFTSTVKADAATRMKRPPKSGRKPPPKLRCKPTKAQQGWIKKTAEIEQLHADLQKLRSNSLMKRPPRGRGASQFPKLALQTDESLCGSRLLKSLTNCTPPSRNSSTTCRPRKRNTPRRGLTPLSWRLTKPSAQVPTALTRNVLTQLNAHIFKVTDNQAGLRSGDFQNNNHNLINPLNRAGIRN